MANDIDDDERTNTVGLLNTARSYWRSAEHLNATRLKVTHPQRPVTFLFCHAIELYLKAYLRGAGSNLVELKKFGHRVSDLAKVAAEAGLVLEPHQSEVLSHIDDADVAIEARYIVTGFKNLPTNEALSSVAELLDHDVSIALIKRGFAVHEEKFQPVAQGQNLDDEIAKVEEYIPFMTPKDKQIIGHLLHHNQRMFEAELDGGHARLLLSRGIVRIAVQPGQMVDHFDVPFEVPMHIWEVLVRHKDKFLPYRPEKGGGHPWRVHWIER
jgi:hypothetical protein